MMNTTIEWTFGNFDVSVRLTADIGEGAASAMVLAAAGLNILQRGPASAVEKKLAGYEKRPEGFKRDSITFDDANAVAVKSGFSGTFNLNPKGEPEVLLTYECVTVSEHVKGAGVDIKFTAERPVAARWFAAGDVAATAKAKIGYEGEIGTAEEPAPAMLRAIRDFVEAKRKAELASI